MSQSIREVMTADPIALPSSAAITEAAQAMRDSNIGGVIVLDESQQVAGIVTDRDIAVRAVAEGRDPAQTQISEICSNDLQTLSPEDTVGDAVRLMTSKAIRRVPVVEGGRAVGIVSLGDLAVTQDAESGLADISAAPENN